METCVICKNEHPKYVLDFLIVKKSRKSQFGGVTTTEQLTGAERHAICTKCLFKKVIKNALVAVPVVTIVAFILAVISNGDDISNHLGVVATFSLSWGIIAGLSITVAGMYSQKYRTGYLRKMVWERAGNSNIEKIYVPLGDNLYRNQESFINRNEQFVTDVGKRLYSELIATGIWKEYVAVTLFLTGGGSDPVPKIEVPEGEHKTLLSVSVQELLRLYQQTPGGFLSDSTAAMPVRAIGKKLDEAGGFELMLEAHALFTSSNPGMGLARNLEMIWDGIGNWRG